MTISPWSATQQHCLALMGIDPIYYEGIEKNSHAELRVNKQVPKPSSDVNLAKQAPSVQSTPNSLAEEFKKSVAKVPQESIEKDQDSMAKQSATVSVEKQPTELVMAETKLNHTVNHSLSPRINSHSKSLFVLGHQDTFTEVLLGQRLVADLSLYLTYQQQSFTYVVLNSAKALMQLSALAEKIAKQLQVDHNSVFYLLPQGDDQANQLHELAHDIGALPSLIEKKKVIVLPPLTRLLSHPENKRELLQTLIH